MSNKVNHMNKKSLIVFLLVAAVFIVAAFYTTKIFKYRMLFKDIEWNNKKINGIEDSNNVSYELNNKKVKVYIENELIWESDDEYLVQDMFVANIDEESELNNGPKRIRNLSNDELVLLLWKKGRYGIYRPFWVKDDEKEYSQHIFTYNIEKLNSKEVHAGSNEEAKIVSTGSDFTYTIHPKWGSSFIGDVYKEMVFKDGFLFLNNMDDESAVFKWVSFGFEKINDVVFVVAGDNLIHKSIYMSMINNHKGSFDSIYENVKPYLKDSDFSIINLETPVVKDMDDYSDYPKFGSPIEVIDGIKNAGFTAVTLANNHIYDKGVGGVNTTIQELENKDIIHIGVNDDKPYKLVKRNGIIFSLLNFTYGVNSLPSKKYEDSFICLNDEERVRGAIREAYKNSDAVIVFVHWGDEYSEKVNEEQEYYAKVFYDEGVNVVVGTHPHVSQKYELYNDKMLIYYSIGNFISSKKDTDKNNGGLAKFSFNMTPDGVKITQYDYLKIDTVFKANNE